MRSWLRSLTDSFLRSAFAAFVVVPPVAAAVALVEVSRQDWIGQGLAPLAANYVVLFVARAALTGFVVLVGAFAAARATSPGPEPLAKRLADAAVAWGLLLLPVYRLLQPTFQLMLLENADSSLSVKVLLTIPQSLASASASFVALLVMIRLVRSSLPALRVPRVPLLARPRAWALAPGLMLLLAIPAAEQLRPAPPAGSPNLVLIVVDTLRADRLGAYGYASRPTSPLLDAFARDSVVYEKAASAAPWTTPSMASMFTSRYPRRHGFRRVPLYLAPGEVSFAEVLRARGYRTHAVVSNVCSSSAVGLHAGFDDMDESALADHADVSSAAITDRAIAWLERRGDAPFLLYVHYLDPHFAYVMHEAANFAPDYRGRFRNPISHVDFVQALHEMTPDDLDFIKASYDSELVHTDMQVGRLLEGLRRLGLYDRSQIVFTSDHGEAFGDRGDRFVGHGPNVFEELLHVPLIVKNPGSAGAGTRVRGPVSTLDIAPSLLAAAGLSFPAGQRIDGVPLAGEPDPARTFVGETRRDADRQAIYRGRWKLLHDRSLDTSILVDLESDPAERNDLTAAHGDVASDLEAALDAWEQDVGDPAGTEASFSPAQRERLEGLGYAQ